MLTDKTEGTLQVGETLPVTFQMKSAGTYFEKGNQATLVVHTNDPTQKVVNYHITLDRNAAPTVTLPKGTPTVAEGDTVYVSLTATDADGDDYTLSLSDDSGIASIATAEATDGTSDVTSPTAPSASRAARRPRSVCASHPTMRPPATTPPPSSPSTQAATAARPVSPIMSTIPTAPRSSTALHPSTS